MVGGSQCHSKNCHKSRACRLLLLGCATYLLIMGWWWVILVVSCGFSEADSHALCQMKCFRGEWADNTDSWNGREKGFLCAAGAACVYGMRKEE